MELTCIVCGKKFEAKKSTKKYCSLDCINAKRRADRITKGRGERRIIMECQKDSA